MPLSEAVNRVSRVMKKRPLLMMRLPIFAHRLLAIIWEKTMAIFFFQADDGIRDGTVTGVQTCALPICTTQAALEASANAEANAKAKVSVPQPVDVPPGDDAKAASSIIVDMPLAPAPSEATAPQPTAAEPTAAEPTAAELTAPEPIAPQSTAPQSTAPEPTGEDEPESDASSMDFTTVIVKNHLHQGESQVDEIELPSVPGAPAVAVKEGDKYSELASGLKAGPWLECRGKKHGHQAKLSDG